MTAHASTRLHLNVGEISFSNLPLGQVRISKLERAEALRIVSRAIDSGTLVSSFPFKAVPCDKDARTLADILKILAGDDGVAVPEESFFDEVEEMDDDGRQRLLGFPNPGLLYTVAPGAPMLVVSYYFEPRAERAEGESILDRYEVSRSTMDFHLVEAVGT